MDINWYSTSNDQHNMYGWKEFAKSNSKTNPKIKKCLDEQICKSKSIKMDGYICSNPFEILQ